MMNSAQPLVLEPLRSLIGLTVTGVLMLTQPVLHCQLITRPCVSPPEFRHNTGQCRKVLVQRECTGAVEQQHEYSHGCR